MELFNNGNTLYKENYYFSKWTVLPIFFRKEGIFSIKFFFLEPMVRSRAMYIQFDFDTNTREVIDTTQSFGSFNVIA